MYIVKLQPNSNFSRPSLQEWAGLTPPPGYALCPDEFYNIFYSTTPSGFVNLEVENGIVTNMTINQEALDEYVATLPEENPLQDAQLAKVAELSAACNKAITAGMDVETTEGTEHFSLEETDQINLTAALSAVEQGAKGYPYHADKKLCRMFTAVEIKSIAETATKHKLYHTTLCNHLLTWARRVTTVEELEQIAYTAEDLPTDLAQNMAKVLAASGVSE